MLTLYEELYLLAIHEEKGKINSSIADDLAYGLSGALLAELALQGCLRVHDNHRVELADSAGLEDNILDSVLSQLRSADRERKITYWVRTLSEKDVSSKLRKKLTRRLIEKSIVSEDDTHLQWVIPTKLAQSRKALPSTPPSAACAP